MNIQKTDYKNKCLYVGIDVHKQSWSISINFEGLHLKSYRMNPSVEELVKYLRRHYPGAKYKSVYEAGFSGFWIDRSLRESGVENIVVNPGDVPTRNKEKQMKTDRIDSRKLSRELYNGTLEGIYIPGKKEESLRVLNRLRIKLTKESAGIKNRIKSLLNYTGKKISEEEVSKHWSKRYIEQLKVVEFSQPATKYSMDSLLRLLEEIREEISQIIKEQRRLVRSEARADKTIKLLQGIPGIGFKTALTLYTELIDQRRFSSFEKLSSYIGLAPAVHSSGERERVLGIGKRKNVYIRNMLIESAWIAIRKDPAMMLKYTELSRRMCKQKAIIRIAKKILSRLRYVWLEQQKYEFSVLK